MGVLRNFADMRIYTDIYGQSDLIRKKKLIIFSLYSNKAEYGVNWQIGYFSVEFV